MMVPNQFQFQTTGRNKIQLYSSRQQKVNFNYFAQIEVLEIVSIEAFQNTDSSTLVYCA